MTVARDRRSVLTGLGALGVAGCAEVSQIGGTGDSAALREAVIADATGLTRSPLGYA